MSDGKKTARFVKSLATGGDMWGPSQSVFAVDPPLNGSPFVVASAVTVMGEPETYLFESDEDGKILNWSELSGSFRGDLNHAEALRRAGYEVVS